jgi:hypothetical protein
MKGDNPIGKHRTQTSTVVPAVDNKADDTPPTDSKICPRGKLHNAPASLNTRDPLLTFKPTQDVDDDIDPEVSQGSYGGFPEVKSNLPEIKPSVFNLTKESPYWNLPYVNNDTGQLTFSEVAPDWRTLEPVRLNVDSDRPIPDRTMDGAASKPLAILNRKNSVPTDFGGDVPTVDTGLPMKLSGDEKDGSPERKGAPARPPRTGKFALPADIVNSSSIKNNSVDFLQRKANPVEGGLTEKSIDVPATTRAMNQPVSVANATARDNKSLDALDNVKYQAYSYVKGGIRFTFQIPVKNGLTESFNITAALKDDVEGKRIATFNTRDIVKNVPKGAPPHCIAKALSFPQVQAALSRSNVTHIRYKYPSPRWKQSVVEKGGEDQRPTKHGILFPIEKLGDVTGWAAETAQEK